jgi:hypothetical protein
MKKIFLWIASSIEDKKGSISSKRIGFFWCLWMLSRAVTQPNINEIVLYTIAGLAFGLAGLTIPEWFSNIKNKPNEQV